MRAEWAARVRAQQRAWDSRDDLWQRWNPRGDERAMNWRGYAEILDDLAMVYARAGMDESAESTRNNAEAIRRVLAGGSA